MFRVLLVSAFVSCVCGFPHAERKEAKSNNMTEKIVGGQSTTIEMHPYQVSLITNDGKNSFVCGGSIIGKRWVLTAAHCLSNMKTVTIRAGSTYLHKGGTTYVTKVFKPHPSYNGQNFDYDVAVVQSPRDIVLNSSTVKIITMAAAGSSVAPGTQAVVSGWGRTTPDGKTSETLRDVSLPIVDRAKCAEIYKGAKQPITSRMLCAGIDGTGKDKCKGDSGGPLVLNEKQIGIVSFGVECGSKNFPGVYCDVGSVRNWIKQTTGI